MHRINAKKDKFKEKILESVQHNDTVSLIMYMWTSLDMESYMTVDEDWKLQSSVIKEK